MRYTYTIAGNPITKKNSMRMLVNRKTGRPFPAPSAAYKAYKAQAMQQLGVNRPYAPIATPVQVTCRYYMQTRRRVDLTNLLEATDDILVKAGVLQDDNCGVIASHDGSRVLYDKQHPRVEVEIMEVKADNLGRQQPYCSV